MKYALEDLMRIRESRKDRAQGELADRRQREQTAARAVVQKREALEDVMRWRVEQQEILFQQVQSRVVKRKDLDDLWLKIDLMKEQEAAHARALQEAESALESARRELDHARQAYLQAFKELQKIEEHKRIWIEDALREADQAMETELEDFRPKSDFEGELEEEQDSDHEDF